MQGPRVTVNTAMVNHTAPTSHTNASTESSPADSQDYENGILNGFKAVAPVYDWSSEIQGIILSSFNYGSLLTPLLVGYVAGIFGVKHVVDAGLFICSALNLFIPLAADTGVTLLIVIRIVQGIAQIMVLTGQYSIWTKWAPSLERSQLITIALSGVMLGNFIIFALGGLLCQTIGWPYIFYIFGGIGCVCCALCFLLVYDDPLHHPFISTGEKMYIQRALAKRSLPIKAMIKSLPLWAILVSAFCQSWAYLTMATHTPIYIRSVLHVNIRDSGILSSVPSVFAFVFMIIGGLLADFLLSRKCLRLISVRKLFTAIGTAIPSMFLVSLYWVRSSASTSVVIVVRFYIFRSISFSGIYVNILDIAPRYSSFLKGVLQVIMSTAGAISPTITGFVISQDSDLGWRNIFLISAALNILGLMIYLIFGEADVQDWAKEQTTTHL
ncbi:probable small intestine urate exporter isoform X2 [Echinops telfairi]|uniref:Probable small intestine urate exporter isoform X2 n=1 Tax=Echinops telfairi TaxID=9371 RepID=A0AC55DJ08_ECHTE|nr:probable small intestine urate exporter isoform X2 [Echinops telfairi]